MKTKTFTIQLEDSDETFDETYHVDQEVIYSCPIGSGKVKILEFEKKDTIKVISLETIDSTKIAQGSTFEASPEELIPF